MSGHKRQKTLNLLLITIKFGPIFVWEVISTHPSTLFAAITKILFILPIYILVGCASQPSYSKQKDLIQPLLQTEFKNIIESAPEGSRVGVDWCFDLRFEEGTVSAVSDWVQRQIEKLLVDSKKFAMVSRRYLMNVQREQDLQLSSRVDEKTAVSICRNLGLSYLVIPEITQSGTLSIQLIDAETDQIFYINLVDFY